MERQKNKPSFSAETKAELLQIKSEKKEDRIFELAALIRLCGSLSLQSGIRFEVEKPAYAKRIFSHLKALYGISAQISMKEFRKLGKTHKYLVLLEDANACQRLLRDTHYFDEKGAFTSNNAAAFLKRDSSRKCYLRMVFLISGSITNPEKNYHLELVLSEQPFALQIQKALQKKNLNAKMIHRKNTFVVYLKDAENIVDFLTYIGAQQSILEFYNVKILKEVRNNVNRAVNCETANIQKTVDAAARQVHSIELIRDTKGLSSLPEELEEVARLRLSNQDASLQELLELLPEKISKSGLNHRLRKLDGIAREIEEEPQ